jgi:hypothetical protein
MALLVVPLALETLLRAVNRAEVLMRLLLLLQVQQGPVAQAFSAVEAEAGPTSMV